MAKKASKLYSIYLTIKISLSCIYHTGQANIISYFKKLSNNESTKIIKNFAYYTLKPLKINFIYKNWNVLEQTPDDRIIILMSNHSSLYDIPILLHAMPNNIHLRMLAKKELTKIPIFGRGMVKLGCPTIDRKNRKQAMEDLEKTKQLLQEGISLWVSPEGTRSIDGNLLRLKKGVFMMAIELDAIIIPIGINGANKVLPAKTSNYSINETVILTAGEPIDTKLYNKNDRDTIMEKTREEITKAMS